MVLGSAVVVAGLVAGPAASAAFPASSPPVGPVVVDCGAVADPFADAGLPEPQTVMITLGDVGGQSSIRYSGRRTTAGTVSFVVGADPDVAGSADVFVSTGGVVVAEFAGLEPGTTCRVDASLVAGHYVAMASTGDGDVEWWVVADLYDLPGGSGQVVVRGGLLGGDGALTDACDVFGPEVVAAAVPADLGAAGVATEVAPSTPGPDEWQSDCLYTVPVLDGADTAVVALSFGVPGDAAAAQFAAVAEADAERADVIELTSPLGLGCYLVDHSAMCPTDDGWVRVHADLQTAPLPAGAAVQPVDVLAVSLLANVVSRLS